MSIRALLQPLSHKTRTTLQVILPHTPRRPSNQGQSLQLYYWGCVFTEAMAAYNVIYSLQTCTSFRSMATYDERSITEECFGWPGLKHKDCSLVLVFGVRIYRLPLRTGMPAQQTGVFCNKRNGTLSRRTFFLPFCHIPFSTKFVLLSQTLWSSA